VAGNPEPETGKIRLKPKLTPEPTPAESAAAPEPEPVREKIRLKPQTASEPAATPASADPSPPAPAAEAETPAAEPPKVKLKIKIPGALTEAAAAAATPEAAPEAPATPGKVPPPFPVVATPGPEAISAPGPVLTRPGMPGKPGVPGRNSGPPVRRVPASMAASARRKKFLKAILVALGGVAVAAGMIALAISKFINPPPPSRVPKPREVVTTPFVETPTSIPEEVAPEPTHSRQKSKSGATTTSATTDLAPGVTVTSEDVVAEIEASQSFRSFVADAKISGVFQGTPPRAFINGRLIRVGETVDSSLGIRFESIDPKTQSILFKDTSGATVSRRY
jgi:hypothetical protein